MSRAQQVKKIIQKLVPDNPGKYDADVPILHEGAGPLAGSLDDIPLEAPHVSSKKLPTYAGTEDDARLLENALNDRPKTTQQVMESVRAERAARTNPDDMTSPGFGAKLFNAASLPQKALLNKISAGLGVESAEDVTTQSQNIADSAAEKLGVSDTSTAGVILRTLLATGAEAGLDPLNAVPVTKIAQGARKAVPAFKNLQKLETLDGVLRKFRAKNALEALGAKKPTLSTAERLAQQGAERIVPKGKIVPAKE